MPTCAVVRADERVFLSAAGAVRSDGSVAGAGDPGAQTNAAMDQLKAAMHSAGGSLANIAKLRTCVVDWGFRTACYQVIQQRLRGIHPVSSGPLSAAPVALSCLIVKGLTSPELLMEVDVHAISRSPQR